MGGFLNWVLVILGAVLILTEVVLGAATGFDLLLIGSAVLLGGILGLVTHSPALGVACAGVLSLAYVLFGRRRIRNRLRRPGIPTNTDLLLGKSARVLERIESDRPGRVRFEGDEWRAVLEHPDGPALEPGQEVLIRRIEGVTLVVAPAGGAGGEGVRP